MVNSLLILFTNKKPLVIVLKKKDGIKEVNASIRLVSVLFSEKSNFFQAKQKAKKQLRKRRLHAGLFWSVKDLLLNPSPTKTNRFFSFILLESEWNSELLHEQCSALPTELTHRYAYGIRTRDN
ncbi:hypothetical protein EQG68_01675 [Flavobacterium piscinae]|uniref:Uncharacterized protein n=1 Tax=Flavobacterium piscinae TaxID=2506424 RepID=A0A4Q1KZ68_9FLAO|nr:hypothetical protein EQG68_01675 [Flavobacterium piscinae]